MQLISQNAYLSLVKNNLQRANRPYILADGSVRTVLRLAGDDDSAVDRRFDEHVANLASGINKRFVGIRGWGTDLDCQLMAAFLQKPIRVVFEHNVVIFGVGDHLDPTTLTFYRNHWQHAKNPYSQDRLSFEDMMMRLVRFAAVLLCHFEFFCVFGVVDYFVLLLYQSSVRESGCRLPFRHRAHRLKKLGVEWPTRLIRRRILMLLDPQSVEAASLH
jgi:hypothetical protein